MTASALATQTEELEVHHDTHQFLTFAVGDTQYGVDIMKVREIKAWHPTTRLPNSPEYMRGVINLRGVVIPIFDLRTRFQQGTTEAKEKNVVIIMIVKDRVIGMLVDAVSDIVNITNSEIKPPPDPYETSIDERFISGLLAIDENQMVILLEVDQLFDVESLEAAESAPNLETKNPA